MIRVYYLKSQTSRGVTKVDGADLIHDAIVEVEGSLRKLIQDTTDDEHKELIKVAESCREASQDEIQCLADMKAEVPATARDLAGEIDRLEARICSLESKIF